MAPTYSRDEIIRKLQRGDKMDRADLRGLDLSRQRFVKAMLDRSDLEGANLEGSELSQTSLRRASLREAYLVGTDLSGANLENADLEGARLERANLSGANLSRANLEGADLTGANLSGAHLGYAQLATAKLGNANLAEAVFTHAELDEAYLGNVLGGGAKFTNARLAGANMEDARFPGANFDEASLRNAHLRNADFSNASIIRADFSLADLTNASLRGADIRHANFTQAVIIGARLTGAKAAGLVGTGSAPPPAVEVTWLDLSPAGDGSNRVENGVIPSVLALGAIAMLKPPSDGRRRYFGRGDVLRNAVLHFDPGAHVEIDSLFQNCTINIGEQTELIIGASGVLADCEIVGAGSVTVHGKFFERQAPGIVGPRQVSVSAKGALVSAVAKHTESTRFAFENGCQLRVKILGPKSEKHEVK
jgi:uncharacterized protein YjbI with pentapeptide repeats